MTTWEEEIKEVMEENGDDYSELITTLSKEELKIKFNDNFGSENGKPFTGWTEKFVYFPVTYDGSEWVECVPRNPCDTATYHVGG